MDILQGLSANQLGSLRVRQFQPGALVFREGDDAYGLFSVMQGSIEICKGAGAGAKRVALMERGSIFGEMALILDTKKRTATARAVETSIVFEVPGNPLELAQALPDPAALVQLLRNLIVVLSARLREANEQAAETEGERFEQTFSGDQTGFRGPIAVIAESLPQEAWLHKRVAEGTELCREGDQADGFYFIHDGKVEILKQEEDGQRLVAKMRAPCMVGEAACFAGEPRMATVRAATPLEYTSFPIVYFDQLRQSDPRQAAEIMLAVARVIVRYITRATAL